jgi:hypothetical protein
VFGDALLLPGFGAEIPLLEQKALSRYLDERGIAGLAELEQSVQSWLSDLRSPSASHSETSLEQSFNQRVMCEALGYVMHPAPDSSLWIKPGADVTTMQIVPDVALGNFAQGADPEFLGVLELKSPGTDLDRPQARKRRLTPVEQAFDYGTRMLGVRWVIVSDMRSLRLYSVESQTSFLRIALADCLFRQGRPSDDLRKLRHLLHRDALIDGGDGSAVSSLLAISTSRKRDIESGFYEIYFKIRADLVAAFEVACNQAAITASHDTILEAVQRLLDRMLFIMYCQDHPSHLIPTNTVKQVTEGARRQPGPNPHKVYDALKALFHEVDSGSTSTSGLALSAYNGELFKHHPIIDVIDLPDTLYDIRYEVTLRDNTRRTVHGVWGFHEFNFWRELDEHLLGSIFEQSLSDVTALRAGSTISLTDRLQQRKQHGIYYTADILANYSLEGVISSTLAELPAIPSQGNVGSALEERLELLTTLRVVDPACGSGAFLVSAYRGLLSEWTRLQESLREAKALASSSPQLGLDSALFSTTQATLLRDTLHGSDLLPQAVEIAKLALWLRSARKDEKVADLGSNIVAADSLRVEELLSKLQSQEASFDAVVGNPPWGAEITPSTYAAAIRRLAVKPPGVLDSWELFVLLALKLLKPNGRLAFILPDTLFAPEKDWIRGELAKNATFERIVNLGMDWFGEAVRMGAIAFQAKLKMPVAGNTFVGFALTGALRRSAIRGRTLLSQVQADRGKDISQEVILKRPGFQILVTQGISDDKLMAKMESHSQPLHELMTWTRGEELSGYGELWKCMGCGSHTVPPDVRRKLSSKQCPSCDATLSEIAVEKVQILVDNRKANGYEDFVDTEDIHRRYAPVTPSKSIATGLMGFSYKDIEKFHGPKILIREAGVGITAGLDASNARLARSMYAYKLRKEAQTEGYSIEYVLAALQSRTLHYYVVQMTNQGDPRRPFANLRIEVVNKVPVPLVDFSVAAQKTIHDEIVRLVKGMLARGGPVGRPEDLKIEQLLRELWQLNGDDGVYIAQELKRLPQFGRLAQMAPDSTRAQNARQRRRSTKTTKVAAETELALNDSENA